ncbi:hypothetical protein UCDDS831_g09313 [Diplodia seriata]|uniref:Uncharacterized protein n=1 Tax=Diplodia seriata TaxID=420778 RepID=A0A0G2DQW5_9PEZI|nr:hypothetical protein UCDDS831_g09313 [Diplodia seriata]
MTIDTIKDADKDLNTLYASPSGLTIRATIPTVRATLTCTYFAPEHVHITYIQSVDLDPSHYDPDPSNPYTEFSIWTDPTVQRHLPVQCRGNVVTRQLPGNLHDHQSQPFAWLGTSSSTSTNDETYDDCSHAFAAFGSSLRNGSAQTMACVPAVEQVDTDTTFSLPTYQITAATTKDATARAMANYSATSITLNEFMPVGTYGNASSSSAGGNYDAVFSALLSSPAAGALTPADFDPAASAHHRIADALQHLFRLTTH